MGGEDRTATIEELLAQTGWLRQLALRLAGDADTADDAVQETWIAALRRSPETDEPVRPWLATVLRNALRMHARSDRRRAAREQDAHLLQDDVPTPELLVAKAEAQRLLAGLVVRLSEPYRSTVLLHYCEGMSLADIARSQGIASGTARWRLKTALDQMREWLDDQSGDRRRWAIVPLLALPKGVLVAEKSTNVVAAILLLLALLFGGGVYMLRGGQGQQSDPERRASSELPGNRPHSVNGASLAAPAWLSQPGVMPRRIAGRVTFRGAPVRGATVELASLATESGLVAPLRRSTNEAGEFDFGPQSAMEWSVRASAQGKTGAALSIDLRNPVVAPPPEELEIELGACEAALIGTVRDASGGPLKGARVARLASGGVSRVPGGVAAMTNEQGAYELCVERIWPGRIVVEVSADGYGAIVFAGIVLGRVTVDFALVPEATIVGRVVRDDTGEPVPLAHVFLPQGPRGIESTSWRGTFTDDNGRFRIDQVAPGRHVVFARAEGMVSAQRGTPVSVDAGQTSEEIEIRLEPGSVLRGVVVQDGRPVAGARVAAIAVDGLRSGRTAVSQKDGSFALEEVPRGEVRFTAWPYEVMKPASFQVDSAEHEGVVLEVESLGAIVGSVVRGDRPVPGARVHIHGPNETDLEPVHTDANGRFEARGLQPGPWVLFGESGHDGRFGRAPGTVQLARGETEEVTIDLAYGAAIAGKVVDEDGAPVPGVSVQFWHTEFDDVGVAITSVDGSFRAATMVGGGQYRTTVRPYQGSNVFLRPAAGKDFPLISLADGDSEVTGVVIAVQLDRLAISGTVVDTSGVSVPDARVSATMVKDDAEPSFFRWVHYAAATTDVDGAFSIGELAKGTYALQARSPLGAEVTIGGVRAGDNGVVLTLPTPGSIEGTLAGFGDTPDVTALRANVGGPTVPAIGKVSGNSFVLRDLSPGAYIVTARNAREAATGQVEVAAGATAQVTLTGGGSGSVIGRVAEFSGGQAVEGMTCRAQPRLGEKPTSGFTGQGARTDSNGGFVLAEVPAGDIVVACVGAWRSHSDGLRLIELPAGETAEIDVPVVAARGDVKVSLGGFGADIDPVSFVPLLVRVRPGGPAATAGFRDGDRIIAVNGASVTTLSPRGVWMLIGNHPPGTKVSLTVTRGSDTVTADLVLVEYDVP